MSRKDGSVRNVYSEKMVLPAAMYTMRVCLEMKPLSIGIYLATVPGEFDDFLKWPYITPYG
eukprot:NODE_429_length_1758_cov_79.145114_g360_i0.p5 GENE.NODE_429_length_1758_cov_79.145114_g360_i0~~NODE_429_length_1758_cov_79.145114_g360_i0.p5  ORF type:complete len:61 (+),score=11.07 NODE_429_length_1758_cov_79.145114_g360_i0:564-746(+)